MVQLTAHERQSVPRDISIQKGRHSRCCVQTRYQSFRLLATLRFRLPRNELNRSVLEIPKDKGQLHDQLSKGEGPSELVQPDEHNLELQ